MAELETEISTPAETTEEVTSTEVEPTEVVTSTEEPSPDEKAAETETDAVVEEPKLYAGKYKSIEDFEKGHNELYGAYTKAKEYQNKYNELLKNQQEETQRLVQQRLEQAQRSGFRTVEEQEIDNKLKGIEYQLYANNINAIVSPEYIQDVNNLLTQYYATGHKAYLDEAKRYYNSDFIEQAASTKAAYQQRFQNEFNAQRQARIAEEQARIDGALKTEFAEFLADAQANPAKDLMFKALRGTGVLSNADDMKVFVDYYSQMAKYEREQAIREYEAQKAIDAEKNRAKIQGDTLIARENTAPTLADINRMTQAEYNAAVDKWGLEKILTAK